MCVLPDTSTWQNMDAMREMAGRTKPGVEYDTITFTGLLVADRIALYFIQANNTGDEPSISKNPVARVMDAVFSWKTIEFKGPFVITWVVTTYYILDCGSVVAFPNPAFTFGYRCIFCDKCSFSCLDNPKCEWGCSSLSSPSTMSITVATGGGCPAQVLPVAVLVTGSASPDATTTATSEPRSNVVLLASIIAPIVVVVGVAAGLLIFLLHRRSVRKHGTEWRSKMKESALQDARSRYLANVTPERTPEHSSVDIDN